MELDELDIARKALRLAATRIEILHDRMMACNVQSVQRGEPPVHELIGEAVDWYTDIMSALADIENEGD